MTDMFTNTHDADPADSGTISGDNEFVAAQISRDVGSRLRALREQRQMSLHDVEEFSDGSFVPSTIGAYERGERAISLPRLHRLAGLYGVPIEQLVPLSPAFPSGYRTAPIGQPLRIDLSKLSLLDGEGFSSVSRFVDNIRNQRGDSSFSICTLRGADAIVIGAMLDVPVEQVVPRLQALDLAPIE